MVSLALKSKIELGFLKYVVNKMFWSVTLRNRCVAYFDI